MTPRRWVVLVSLAALGQVVSCGLTVVPTVTTDTGVSAGTRLRPVILGPPLSVDDFPLVERVMQ